MDFLTRTKNEIDEQVSKYQSHIGRFSYQESEEKLRKSILQDEILMSLYGRRDSEELFYDYMKKIVSVKKDLFDDEDSIEFIVAKIYEFIRLTTVSENIMSPANKDYLNDLGTSSVNPMLIGKTTDLATTRLVRDMLPSYVDSKIISVKQNYKESPALIVSYDGSYYYLNPVKYDGNTISNDDKLFLRYDDSDVKPLYIDDRSIILARSEVANYLIRDLKIDVVSEKIINDEMSKFDKQCAILGYLETIINTSNMPVSHNVVKINGRLMELGKVMELFFIYNNIPYSFECEENKDNAIYDVVVDGTSYSLDPSVMYNSYTGKITEKTLYKKVNNERKYLFELDEVVGNVYAQKLLKGYYVGLEANEEIFKKEEKGLAV